MKKETLTEILLGTSGGIIFAIGMCMCLIPEWNLFKVGCIVALIGFIILLCIIPIYRSNHPKKSKTESINWSIIFAWIIGIIAILIMGFGMSKVMVDNPSNSDMLIGIITSIIGLMVCVLNYPIYSFIKSNKIGRC